MSDDISSIIIETIRDLIPKQGLELPDGLSNDTYLFGEGGILDSMGLVSLVIAVEEAIFDNLGKQVTLADEKAMSQTNSPYRTVASLAEYARSQIQE